MFLAIMSFLRASSTLCPDGNVSPMSTKTFPKCAANILTSSRAAGSTIVCFALDSFACSVVGTITFCISFKISTCPFFLDSSRCVRDADDTSSSVPTIRKNSFPISSVKSSLFKMVSWITSFPLACLAKSVTSGTAGAFARLLSSCLLGVITAGCCACLSANCELTAVERFKTP